MNVVKVLIPLPFILATLGPVGQALAQAQPDAPSTATAHKTLFDPARCAQQAGAPYGQTLSLSGTNMMVASADVNASAAGCKVLANGGTAIDAAIAVQGVLSVTEAFASGLAGGALITYYDAATHRVRLFDGLSSAPSATGGVASIYQAAVPDDLHCKTGLTHGASLSAYEGNTNISGRAVGVPGALKVLDKVHALYGKTAWNRLWDDAIRLASNGFPMTPTMYANLYDDHGSFDEDSGVATPPGPVPAWVSASGVKGPARCTYKDIQARYCDPSDPAHLKPLPVHSIIRNPELATTLAQVRDGGAAAFYDANGPIVKAILARFQADKTKPDGTNNCSSIFSASDPEPARIPSLMSSTDFSEYRALERTPLIARRFGLDIYTQPPPSFGGMVVLYSLGIDERKQVEHDAFGSTGYVFTATEASRLANADRRNLVGDPDFSNTSARVMAALSDAYLDKRAALITGKAIGASVPAGTVADGIPPFVATDPPPVLANGSRDIEDLNTTSHIAIVDGYGNALSMTTTINTHFGAHIEAAGMLLNDALSNFSAGAVGSDVNGLAPRKRPRSAIAPSLAFDTEGRLRLVWGSAGGGPIPDYIVKTFLGNVAYGKDLQAAIDAGNWSGQVSSASVTSLESGNPIASLLGPMQRQYGYAAGTIGTTGLASGLSGIAVTYDAHGNPVYHGAADNRRNGAANGY